MKFLKNVLKNKILFSKKTLFLLISNFKKYSYKGIKPLSTSD